MPRCNMINKQTNENKIHPPIRIRVLRLNGGILATSSYKVSSCLSNSVKRKHVLGLLGSQDLMIKTK